MIKYSTVPFLISLFISTLNFSPTERSGIPMDDNVIGYKYNLWAIKATSLSGEGSYDFTGRIFLDKRKSYKSTFDKHEHSFMYKYEFQNKGIHYFRGNQTYTEVVKHAKIQEYYIALKFDKEWVHHTYEDIIKSQDILLGTEVECSTCNFSRTIFTDDKNWSFTLFYEIRPIYKEDDSQSLAHIESETSKNKMPKIGVSESIIEDPENEPIQVENSIPVNSSISYHVLFKVMTNPDEEFNELKDFGPIYKETFDKSGTTRYLIGTHYSYAEIKKVATGIYDLGFKDCMIAKYKDGKLKSYLNIK